jgi:hypothetical protein
VHAKYEVSREEIRREALGQSLDAEQTQHLLDRLVKAGWLRRTSTVTGGRKRHRWQVNSKIHAAGTAETARRGLTPPTSRRFRTSRIQNMATQKPIDAMN